MLGAVVQSFEFTTTWSYVQFGFMQPKERRGNDIAIQDCQLSSL